MKRAVTVFIAGMGVSVGLLYVGVRRLVYGGWR